MSYQLYFNYENDKSLNTEIWIACSQCATHTAHKVVSAISYNTGYDTGHDIIHYWGICQIVMCQGCKECSFRKVTWDSETLGYDSKYNSPVPIEKEEVFPNRRAGRKPIVDMWRVPEPIRSIYKETDQALSNNQYILTGIGVRSIVEAICKDKQSSGKKLEEMIDDLVTKGVLTQEGAEILHSTRLMGNKAAHEVKVHSGDELATAMEVVEHLMIGAYILPKKASELPKRTNK